MHRSETLALLPCAECGVETAAALERGFSIDAETVICFDCAVQRGGRWDEERALWSREPDVVGLVRFLDPAER